MIAMTGATGFLGWHTRAAARERGVEVVPVGTGGRFDPAAAATAVAGADRVIHLAGVNRGTEDEVTNGNVLFATQLADAIVRAEEPPATVVFANSIQSVLDNPYGVAKRRAAEVLRMAAESVGAVFQDELLPNLFGEHGRPAYNSVTATFAHAIAAGQQPRVDEDRELTLLHAQDAADRLIGVPAGDHERTLTVSALRDRLLGYAGLYGRGEIPDIADRFDLALFNTYRSYVFPVRPLIPLVRHADARGSFFEVTRTHGGSGQSSFSTSEPGVTRGQHFHRRKIERFTVLVGTARIGLRKLFSDEVLTFDVSGDEPVAVDMPTMWVHNITNTGTGIQYLALWTNDIFDPENPDTIPEDVE